jgi:photosystem II stability/assembly factor-like uncharacterized protein
MSHPARPAGCPQWTGTCRAGFRVRRSAAALLAGAALLGIAPRHAATQQVEASVYRQLPFRYIGPVGNRVSAVVGIPGDVTTYYVGSASGGIFRTDDAGATWQSIFDDHDVASIGALAIAPSNPSIIWAGTGEAHIRSNVSVGNGIYRSLDGGATWQRRGLERTGRIAHVMVDPRNPDVVLVAAVGHGYGPQEDRGVFRTRNGGETWERVLFVDPHTGAADLAMDHHNPDVLYAGMWSLSINTSGRISGGPGSGIYRSRDGGTTWQRLQGNGLPEQRELGRIGLAIAPSDSRRIYALIETGQGMMWKGERTSSGTLWRSDDAGTTWRMMTSNREIIGRAAYYTHVVVAPDNPDEAYFLTATFSRTRDGGATFQTGRGYPETAGGHNLATPPQGDFHAVWIDPTNPERMIVGNDGGIGISVNRGRTWNRIQLPNAQMYHVAVDNQIPYNVYGNRQDGPSFRGPSNSLVYGYGRMVEPISRALWRTVGGGESGWTIPDSSDPNVVWSSSTASGGLGGSIDRYDERTGQFRRVELWPENPSGSAAADLRYRFHWTFPVAMSPHDSKRVYAGSQYVHETTNGGQSWQVISPDLTLNDRSRQGPSGGLTGDNIGVEYGSVLMAIAESPVRAGVIWTGSNDGQVNVTRDGGRSWTNVTAAIPQLPGWGTVYSIDPSPHDAATAYVVFDRHQEGDFDPYVYRTSDYGASWTNLSATVPRGPLSYAHAIKEDPARRGLLYLGTENALYISFDDGAQWLPLRNNLPPAPVYGITVQAHFNDLVLATYGRGFWILDDLTPLRQLTPDVLRSAVHLFAPRPAYRFRGFTPPSAPSYDPTDGTNPPYGASINYFLGAVPAGPVRISILDASGELVRTIAGTTHAGINRVWWNLETEPLPAATLWTPPLEAEWVTVPATGRRLGGGLAMLAPPGEYTVRIIVDGVTETQPLTVLKDPHSAGSEADIRAQLALQREIRSDYARTTELIDRVELLRRQLGELQPRLAGAALQPVARGAAELADSLVAVAENLHQLRLTGGQDGVRWPRKLFEKLSYLFGNFEGDFPPTDQQVEVHQQLRGELRALELRFDALVARDVERFNQLLAERGLPPVTVPARGVGR